MIVESKKNAEVVLLDQNISKADLITRREERNDFSGSSSEVGSDSSKFKDGGSHRSKSSLTNNKSQGSPNFQYPWYPGNHTKSFNKKILSPRPRSTGGRYSEKTSVLARVWCSNPSSPTESRCTTPRASKRRGASPQRRNIIENKEDKENTVDENHEIIEQIKLKKLSIKKTSDLRTPEKKSRDLKSPEQNSRIARPIGIKSIEVKSMSLKSSELKSSSAKSELKSIGEKYADVRHSNGKALDVKCVNSKELKSSDCKELVKSSDNKSLVPRLPDTKIPLKSSIPKVIPYSNTKTFSVKSNVNLPKCVDPSQQKPSSSSVPRYSETLLSLQPKSTMGKNRLTSDSVLVGKEIVPSNGSKSLERPKNLKPSKLQRPRTTGSILCKNPNSDIKDEEREHDNIVVNRNLQIVRRPDIEVVSCNENVQTAKRRASDKDYEILNKNSSVINRRDSEHVRSSSPQV